MRPRFGFTISVLSTLSSQCLSTLLPAKERVTCEQDLPDGLKPNSPRKEQTGPKQKLDMHFASRLVRLLKTS